MRQAIRQFTAFLTDVCDHYEKTAPTVHAFADDLYQRINSAPESVTLLEIIRLEGLLDTGEWEQPNYAANRIYKLESELGRATTGHAGF